MECMGRDLSFNSFLQELVMRLGAAAVVVGIFFGLGYANRTNFLGLSSVLGDTFGFFAVAFLLVGVVSACWIVFQRFIR